MLPRDAGRDRRPAVGEWGFRGDDTKLVEADTVKEREGGFESCESNGDSKVEVSGVRTTGVIDSSGVLAPERSPSDVGHDEDIRGRGDEQIVGTMVDGEGEKMIRCKRGSVCSLTLSSDRYVIRALSLCRARPLPSWRLPIDVMSVYLSYQYSTTHSDAHQKIIDRVCIYVSHTMCSTCKHNLCFPCPPGHSSEIHTYDYHTPHH